MPTPVVRASGRAILTVMVVTLGLVAAIPPAGAAPTAHAGAVTATGAAAPGTLAWRSCRGGTVQCAKLTVPLDDTVTGGPTIDLALVRVPARDQAHRIGSLLMNPGGPGASGTDFAASFAGQLPSELQDRFDIIGFDPRGVGESSGVDCTSNLDPLYALDWSPKTQAARSELEAGMKKLVDECVQKDGAILPYLTSDRTARDMDRIREAVGDDKMTYLGFSYGTYLGAQYASQFPDKVRALVLDGPVDPALDAEAVQVQQAGAFEHSLDLFLADCSRRSSCAFHHGAKAATAYDALRARIGETPIAAGHGRKLNGTLFDIGVTQLLYFGKDAWTTLASGLAAAEHGDGRQLLSAADEYTGRSSDGSYGNEEEEFQAIGCADGPPVGDVNGLRKIEEIAAVKAPRLGRSVVNNSMPCAFWPIPAKPAAALHAPTSAPLLVLGTRDDPATPLAWAKGLTNELGSATLVTVGGARHTAFASGNTCVDRAVVRYLVDTVVPKQGTRC